MPPFLPFFLILAGSAFAAVGAPAATAPPPSDDGFWRVLVRPNARWVLNDDFSEEGDHDRVIVETYDVRRIGGAEVARLRWTHEWGKGKDQRETCGLCASTNLTRVAVTSKGLYMLDDNMTDAEIEKALKKRPARSEPPREYQGTKQNEGRYLRRDERAGESLVCMGWEPLPGDGVCDNVCFAELCISPTKGVVTLTGTWAPSYGSFVRDGYKFVPPPLRTVPERQ